MIWNPGRHWQACIRASEGPAEKTGSGTALLPPPPPPPPGASPTSMPPAAAAAAAAATEAVLTAVGLHSVLARWEQSPAAWV